LLDVGQHRLDLTLERGIIGTGLGDERRPLCWLERTAASKMAVTRSPWLFMTLVAQSP